MLATLRCLFIDWKMCSSPKGIAGLYVGAASAARMVPSALASERAAPLTPPGVCSAASNQDAWPSRNPTSWLVISYLSFRR